jgi:RHS repeat-associated protein
LKPKSVNISGEFSLSHPSFGMVMPARQFVGEDYRYGFNGKESDGELNGEGNSYDFGARNFNPRIGRFLSMDSYAGKFAYQSPYLFAGNSPISGVDVNGDSLYVLFYTDNNVHGGDGMFHAAALTRAADLEGSETFNPKRDKVVLIPLTNMNEIDGEMQRAMADYSKTYGETAEVGIWSHAGKEDGPIGSTQDAPQRYLERWNSIEFGWSSKNARFNLFGCRTGTIIEGDASFAQELSTLPNFANVDVGGQQWYAYPSIYTNSRNNVGREEDSDYIQSDDGVTTRFTTTYMVGGERKKEDWDGSEKEVAYPMNHFKNGVKTGESYQPGEKK